MNNIAPWPDFAGKAITEGDTIIHPSGQQEVVIYYPVRSNNSNKWVVDYGCGFESRLCLQIGDKGRAIIKD